MHKLHGDKPHHVPGMLFIPIQKTFALPKKALFSYTRVVTLTQDSIPQIQKS